MNQGSFARPFLNAEGERERKRESFAQEKRLQRRNPIKILTNEVEGFEEVVNDDGLR